MCLVCPKIGLAQRPYLGAIVSVQRFAFHWEEGAEDSHMSRTSCRCSISTLHGHWLEKMVQWCYKPQRKRVEPQLQPRRSPNSCPSLPRRGVHSPRSAGGFKMFCHREAELVGTGEVSSVLQYHHCRIAVRPSIQRCHCAVCLQDFKTSSLGAKPVNSTQWPTVFEQIPTDSSSCAANLLCFALVLASSV